MPIIDVNSTQIKLKKDECSNIGEIIPKLQSIFSSQKYTIQAYSQNGNEIALDATNIALREPVPEQEVLKFKVKPIEDSSISLIQDISSLLDHLLKKTSITGSQIEEAETTSQVYIGNIVSAIDTFLTSINYVCTEVITNKDVFSNIPLKELQIHMLSIIKAIYTAIKKDDLIMLTDLIEYELKDNLTQWKILILPILRQEII